MYILGNTWFLFFIKNESLHSSSLSIYVFLTLFFPLQIEFILQLTVIQNYISLEVALVLFYTILFYIIGSPLKS